MSLGYVILLNVVPLLFPLCFGCNVFYFLFIFGCAGPSLLGGLVVVSGDYSLVVVAAFVVERELQLLGLVAVAPRL